MAKTRRVPVNQKARRQEPAPTEPLPATCDCPRLERDDWHEVESDWSDAQFVQTTIPAVLGVPVRFRSVRERLERIAADLGATVPEDAMLLLGPGRFRRRVLLEVEGAQSGAKGLFEPGGIAYSRLVPAPWGRMRAALNETVAMARERYGRPPENVFMWYLTCSVCSGEREFETLFVAHYAATPGQG